MSKAYSTIISSKRESVNNSMRGPTSQKSLKEDKTQTSISKKPDQLKISINMDSNEEKKSDEMRAKTARKNITPRRVIDVTPHIEKTQDVKQSAMTTRKTQKEVAN